MESLTQHQPEVVDLTCSESLPDYSSDSSSSDERLDTLTGEAAARTFVYFKQYFELFCDFYQAARADGMSKKNSDARMEEVVEDWVNRVMDKDLRSQEDY